MSCHHKEKHKHKHRHKHEHTHIHCVYHYNCTAPAISPFEQMQMDPMEQCYSPRQTITSPVYMTRDPWSCC